MLDGSAFFGLGCSALIAMGLYVYTNQAELIGIPMLVVGSVFLLATVLVNLKAARERDEQ